MKKALVVANLAGFASFLLKNDIKLLQEMGYEVSYAANANKLAWGDTRDKLVELGVKFHQIDFDSRDPFSKDNIKAYKQIKELVTQGRYDVVHCHTPIAGAITRLAVRKQRRHGMKVLYTTHGFAFNTHSQKKTWILYYTMEKFASGFCDAMITINGEDYNNAKRMYCKNVYLINGVGVDTSKFKDVTVNRKAYRESIGVEENQLMVLSVGELSNRKNHKVIIDAIATIKDKNIVYVICGNGINGGTKSMLEKRAAEKNVKLILLGRRADIPQIMAVSDIGAIPSIREGLGLAGVESLASGVPLVGTNVQGIKEYIKDGETGYTCNSDDIEGFAEGIRLLSDVNRRNGMKQKCIDMAEKFSISVSREQMRHIYNSILTNNSNGNSLKLSH